MNNELRLKLNISTDDSKEQKIQALHDFRQQILNAYEQAGKDLDDETKLNIDRMYAVFYHAFVNENEEALDITRDIIKFLQEHNNGLGTVELVGA